MACGLKTKSKNVGMAVSKLGENEPKLPLKATHRESVDNDKLFHGYLPTLPTAEFLQTCNCLYIN